MNPTSADCLDNWQRSGIDRSSRLSTETLFAPPGYRADCIWVFGIAGTVGLAALLCDYLQSSKTIIVEMHTLFAMVSCLAIGRLLMPAYRSAKTNSRRELYLFVRWVSRRVYVFTYFLAAVRVSLFCHEAMHATTLATSLNESLRARPMDDFQFYVVCCLGPLWLLRALLLNR